MALLEANKVVKSYHGRRVVDGVSVSVDAGEIVGLLGRNGAGKTTTFRMCIGMITPESGSVIFENEEVTNLPMYKHAKRGMGYLSQEPSVFRNLSCRNNLLAILETTGHTRKEQNEKADFLLEKFGLTHKSNDLAKNTSGGERRRLEIARSLILEPRMILLDEPFAAVDPHTVEDLQKDVKKLSDDGIAILVTDHNVQQTLRICDRAYIIHNGKNLAEGNPKNLINNSLVKEAYLGSTFKGDEFDQK